MTTSAVPPPPTLQSPQRWFGLRKFLIRAFWCMVCLSVATILWSLWYVNNRGFSRKWRRALTEELEKRGIHATVGRLTLNPLRGLVAKEVKIVHARQRGRVLAYISEVVLDINYSNLVHGDPFVNAVDLRDAQLLLPLNPADPQSERLDISRLNARILLPPNQLYVAQAEADVHGLHVTATGRLINPGDFRPEPANGPDSRRNALQAHQYLRLLDNLKISGGRPSLELQFNGDLAKPSQLFAEAVLRAGQFTVDGSYAVRSAQVTARYSDGLVLLEQCVVADTRGALAASGSFRPGTGEATFQLRSTLDLQALARAAHWMPKADEWVFHEPPVLELSGEALLDGDDAAADKAFHFKGKLLGRLSLDRFSVKSVAFQGASVDFSWDGDHWFVRDFHLSHQSGDLVLSVLHTPGDFRFSLESRINPKALLPLLPAPADEILSEWDFTAAPVFHLEGHGPSLSFDTVEANGSFSFGKTRFRGVGFNSLTSSLAIKNRIVTCRDFKVERPEGSGSGTFSYNADREVATLTGVKSTLTPVDVAYWVDHDRNLPHVLAPYRFRTRPSLLIDGTVQIHDKSELTRLRIDVDGTGLDYTFVKKNLFFPKVKATLWIVRDRLKIEGLDGTLFGGRVRGNADISLEHDKEDYTAEIHADEVDFPALTKLYFGYDTSKGKLSGDYKFAGRGDVARAITGTGSLTVTNGNVFAIPLFGPFSDILNNLLPGTGYNVARKASASFEMKDGVITTPDLAVEGNGFSMFGGGKLFFLDDKIDFTIRINAQGAAGMLLSPVSHLFEYVSDGSLSKPVWRPKRLPKAIFKQ